jgi:NADH:ubiquinone oxidoreductase subunit 6 (subunit J)
VGETRERAAARPLKAVLVGLALAGLLAVVAVASRSGHPGSGEVALHQREVPAQVGNDLLTILVIVYVVAVIALLAGVYWLRGEWLPPRRTRWLTQLFILVAFTALIALLASRVAHTGLADVLRRNAERAQTTNPQTGARTPALPKRPAARKPAELDWVLAAVIGGGLVLAAVIVLARRRDVAEPDEDETIEEELSAVVTDTIDDLRSEPDARRAVIAAYARMEGVLARHGQPRRRSEAPFEYLSRVLLALRVRAAAVRDLTELFERAKFSTHEIDRGMKERAIAALVSIREDLEAAPA